MESGSKWVLLSWLFVDRIVYTLNWLSISPAQPFIASEFGLSFTSLGLLGTVFLVGIGTFQIPAAVLATKYGAKKIALLGFFLSSSFAGLCGLAPNFETLLLLRFLTGVFLSFFFGPGITFFTPLFTAREKGIALGVYNAGFHAGTLLAIGLWPTLISVIGWRNGLLLPGVMGLFLTLVTYRVSRWVNDVADPAEFGLSTATNPVVLASALGLGCAGAAWYPLTQFGILYLNSEKGSGFEAAGVLISVLSVGSLLGAPVSGRLYDMATDRKRLLYILNFSSAAALTVFITTPIELIPLVLFVLGFLYTAANSLFYLAPLSVLPENKVAVSVAVVNSVHLLAASVVPYVFASIVESAGYFSAWLVMSVVCGMSLVFIRLLKI
ncbi:MAG: MFS transporter [Candidatus Caldarchaeum sp.]|nr:MFS transporter [Candidatus Caldarchaeum sp.]